MGPGGPLERHFDRYEMRPGQLEMAAAVEQTLRDERVLLCEAGTGTGKTLAYLVPAILSGKKVVVSTATRALQEQIAGSDLPLIRDVLGLEPRAAVMKGLGNYVCRRRFEEFRSSAEAARPAWGRSLGLVEQWALETGTGDVVELGALEESDPIWSEVTSSSETRIGPRCQHFETCFVTAMRREAERAQLVIVNHHLFFADLALRGPHPARVLPEYDAVVFDEAHRLEDVATSFFGVRVSKARVDKLLRDAERILRVAGLADPLFGGGERLLEDVRVQSDALWRELRRIADGPEARVTLDRDVWNGELEQRWHAIDSALEGVGAFVETNAWKARDRGKSGGATSTVEAVELVGRRTAAIRDELAGIVDATRGNVTWLDTGGRGASLSSAPVDVSGIFRERVFESVDSVVLTSATLASAGRGGVGFEFLRARLGLAGDAVQVDECVVPSPFDYATTTVLYAPPDLPAPNEATFLPSVADRVVELAAITDGGAFVLTTSLRSMRALHRALRQRLAGRLVLVQGQAPKGTLLGQFRAAGDAVLVATMSFWEGVDVPGSALRLVILEKVPFAVPTDPVGRARAAAVEDGGGNPFMDYFVPSAAITLKQGFGRLVRSRLDRGVVALLDPRVHRRGYGKRLLESLPPARRAESLEEVRDFWDAARAHDASV